MQILRSGAVDARWGRTHPCEQEKTEGGGDADLTAAEPFDALAALWPRRQGSTHLTSSTHQKLRQNLLKQLFSPRGG